ncbi:MAG: Gfo/Idh/MocA family oxidoreductase [Pirellulales bacterium]|nr:Gfo/Idh/MocA family oxidoreductase [Pirellulales bacterium]
MSTNKPTRRDILKAGCAAATGMVLPYAITTTALGSKDKPPASERITLGHIGVGNRGTYLLENFSPKTCGAQSVAVADCYAHHREAASKACGGKAYADFREIIARDDIDGVIIATPDHWHVPIAIMAARAGKDTYVEKPLGLTIEQNLVCQKVFREQKRIFQYGTQQRESEHMKIGREMIRSGKLGKLKGIEVRAPNGEGGGSTAKAPVPDGFDYDMWLGPAPESPYTVDRCKPPGTYWVYDQSIGYLAGWGAHPLDILVWCYDGDMAGPYTVEGTGVFNPKELYNTVHDWNMVMQMSDGLKITFTHGNDSTKFIGTEGKLEMMRWGLRAAPQSLLPEWPKFSHAGNVGNHIKSFVDSIRSRKESSSPIGDSVRSDIMSHLCDIAVRTGEKVTWDPKKEQLVNASEKAKAMLSRPMRKPWTL